MMWCSLRIPIPYKRKQGAPCDKKALILYIYSETARENSIKQFNIYCSTSSSQVFYDRRYFNSTLYTKCIQIPHFRQVWSKTTVHCVLPYKNAFIYSTQVCCITSNILHNGFSHSVWKVAIFRLLQKKKYWFWVSATVFIRQIGRNNHVIKHSSTKLKSVLYVLTTNIWIYLLFWGYPLRGAPKGKNEHNLH